jgi:O-antigen/teichoic acid export membrane protein
MKILARPQREEVVSDSPLDRVVSSVVLARNAALNLAAEGWIFLVVIVAMPALVHSLGETSFGLFSLAWVVIGYLTILDVGVSKAATKYLSEQLVRKDGTGAKQTIGIALTTNVVLGVIGGWAFIRVSPLLIRSVFKLSGELSQEARVVFIIVGLAVPVLLIYGALRAILSSFQCFGKINLVNAVVTTAQWGMACWLALNGYGIVAVVSATVIARSIAVIAYGILLFHLLPDSEKSPRWKGSGLLKLLRFGSWVSVSQLVGPLLVYLDRILLASFLSLGAVTDYTVPYEAMTRLRIIPTSLVNTLYPAFSERSVDAATAKIHRLYEGSIRYLLLLLLPPIAILVVLGPDILTVWMGPKFAGGTSAVLQILAVGVLLNALAYIPYNVLQALGRPDLPAKFHVIQLPIHVLLCVLLIPHWGIVGAALANAIRISLDACMLFWAAEKYCNCPLSLMRFGMMLQVLAMGLVLCLALVAVRIWVPHVWGRLSLGIGTLPFYVLATWMFLVDRADKPRISSAIRILIGQPAS